VAGPVYILLLNWNGWQDTVECLESLFRLDYPDFRVIVCDNGSTDGSLEKIKGWAEGRVPAAAPAGHPLSGLSSPPVPKPVSVAEYDRIAAEAGGDGHENSRLVLIRTGGNLGFAGGNNVGLRYALARGDFAYIWLLNNDTVVKPDALSWMVRRMSERPDAGICGSLLPYYDAPDTVWTSGGGTFNHWLAKSCSLDDRRPLREATARDEIERRMKYVAGASMLASKEFLEDVGLLCEDYFLYYEEPDWCFRGRGRYALAYARESIVYHKVGISTARRDAGPDRTAESYFFRAQLLFTRKFFPFALPLVFCRVIVNKLKSAFRRMKRRSC
jgi:GT2 family glycosyltransferase